METLYWFLWKYYYIFLYHYLVIYYSYQMLKTNNFVKKILKNKHKILDIKKLKQIYKDIIMEDYSDKKLYKQIYYAKNKWIILSLKKELFYIKDSKEDIDIDDVINKFYWKMLKKYVKEQYWNNYLIWGIKSLEIWNNNFSIPDKLVLINPYKRVDEVLLKEKKILNKMYKIKWFDDIRSFKFFKKQSTKIHVDAKLFFIANYELSLLESLYSVAVEDERYIIELLKKNIRKNYKKINLEVFEYFLKYWKYWSSIKKIYELSLGIRPDFADRIKDILKKRYWM